MNDTESLFNDSLVEKYGSPLFVVSSEVLKHNIKQFKKIFSEKYPESEVAYAYKANYLSEVLKIIHKEGAWAEVASGFEYEIARKLEVSGRSIVFNGPSKKKDDLLRALEDGALINVDNIDEIELVSEIAREQNRTIDIGIRLNADVGINQVVDRFGFSLESGEAFEAVKLCTDRGFLNVNCLHIHLTSYIVEPDSTAEYIPAQNIKLIWPKSPDMYRIAAEKISKFSQEIKSSLGVEIQYLNLGGGFPTVADLKPYADKIVDPLISVFKDNLPVLILEPGRAIVKNAVSLITTVRGVKEFHNGQRAVTTDAGINILPTSYWGLQNIRSVKSTGENIKDTIIYGPLCLQTDIIARVRMPEIKPGDRLIVENVGAYNIPQSGSFIYPRPGVVVVDNGSDKLIRRAETVEDVFKLEEPE